MNGYEFRLATPPELKRFYEAPALPRMRATWGLFVHGEIKGACGIVVDPKDIGSILEEDARHVAFFDLHLEKAPLPLAAEIVRRVRDWLRDYGRPVWAQHDDRHPQAAKFLSVIGFRPTGKMRSDLQNTGRMLQMWVRPNDKK